MNCSNTIERFKKIENLYPASMKDLIIKGWIREIDLNAFRKMLIEAFKEEIKKNLPEDKKNNEDLIDFKFVKYNSLIDKIYMNCNDKFFEKLKETQPLKYRKAVLEFIKAIT